jgi:hypothetical protein
VLLKRLESPICTYFDVCTYFELHRLLACFRALLFTRIPRAASENHSIFNSFTSYRITHTVDVMGKTMKEAIVHPGMGI